VVLAAVTVPVLTVLLVLASRADGVVVADGRVALVVALGTVQALLLCLRRVRPLLCLTLVTAAQAVSTAAVPPELAIRGVAPVVMGYTVGCLLAPRPAFTVLAAAVSAETVAVAAAYAAAGTATVLPAASQALSAAVSLFGAALVGSYVTTRRRYVVLVRERAAEAVRAQRSRVDAAVSAERGRMARELHDIAAHHLSAMVVQAAAVERLVDRDPAAAKAATAWIRGQGRRTLDDLRLLVGVLRDPEASVDDTAGPVPGLGVLEDLVRTARELGDEVRFDCTGTPWAVPPAADVTLYRIAQEALSNARQHAPGAVVLVELSYRAERVVLGVRNDPPGPGVRARSGPPGAGLVGMRERAQLVGAGLEVGPTADGGWQV
ncbi:MAG: sensor histidine kinase, partial [Phycicoccus sp.]